MTGSRTGRRPRVVVCGTRFGRIYLAAFRDATFPFELAGILARGSERSRRCAAHYGVPLLSTPDQVPADVDIACVVVGARINGGSGAELAQALMARGIHVLQEHPLDQDELADCLRSAHRHGVGYAVNTHYPHLAPVRRFVDTARALLRRQEPLFVDATTAVQVAYTVFDILDRIFDGVRPSVLGDAGDLPEQAHRRLRHPPPYRSIDGVVAGVPLTLRLQNELDARVPDNGAHLFHRITIGTEGGHLTLVNTHGPVLWSPRAHMPADTGELVAYEDSLAEHLDHPSASAIGPAEAPSYREVLSRVWPDGVRRALTEFHDAARPPEATFGPTGSASSRCAS